jgi:pimeloyl-ACP methyl ester carboxylesterase
MVPPLSEHHRVLTFDLVDHGGSEKPSSGYEIESQSAAVAAALNELGVRQATVVGHSMGGLVATSLAEQSSDLVDKLVLIATPAEAGDVDEPFLADMATAPVLGEALWRVKLDSMVKSSYDSAFAPDADVDSLFENPDQLVDDLGDMTYKSFDASDSESDAYLEDGSVVSRLRAIGVPPYAIDGSEDQIIDTDALLAEYQAIPGSRTESIDGAGHSPNVEAPDEVADLILGYIDPGGVVTPVEPAPKPPKPNGGKQTKPQGKPNGNGGDHGKPGEGKRPDKGKKQGTK